MFTRAGRVVVELETGQQFIVTIVTLLAPDAHRGQAVWPGEELSVRVVLGTCSGRGESGKSKVLIHVKFWSTFHFACLCEVLFLTVSVFIAFTLPFIGRPLFVVLIE